MKKEAERQRNLNGFTFLVALVALAASVGGLILGYMAYDKASTPITFLNNGTDGNAANFVEGSIAEIANKVSKSVVSIVSSTKTTNWFGQSYDAAGAGTGVIVTEDGYILTNKHVINGATKLTVILDDGTTYEEVKVVATDPLNDIAFLKIEGASGLTAATLGDSKRFTLGSK